LSVRLLVTRPEPDAERTAATLRARGHTVTIAPLLRIEAIADAKLGPGPWAAILISSANAAAAIAAHARLAELRALSVWAVGRRSAEAMADAGFTNVTSADGNVNDLAARVAAQTKPNAPLLYLAGEERSGDLAGELRAHGFAVETATVYRAIVAETLPRAATAVLAEGIDGVLHFSRRSAAAYIDAARAAGALARALEPIHFCLSELIAEPLRRAGAAIVKVAERPTEAALIALIGVA
jgi:uroporphyrinogen-III synthase